MDELGLFDPTSADLFSEVALAMMAETVSREARAQIKARVCVSVCVVCLRREKWAFLGISPLMVPFIRPSFC